MWTSAKPLGFVVVAGCATYRGDVQDICDAPAQAGIDAASAPEQQAQQMSDWLQTRSLGRRGEALVSELPYMVPEARVSRLRAEAAGVGLPSCSLADWVAEPAALEMAPPPTDAAALEMAPLPTDAAAIDAGGAIYAANCAPCHGADLAGLIGPNLVDDTWLRGGSPDQIQRTVTYGVREKGCPAWGFVFGPEKVAQVTAYVVSQGGGAGH